MTFSFEILVALLLVWVSDSEASSTAFRQSPNCSNCASVGDQRSDGCSLWNTLHAFVPFLGTWESQTAPHITASRRRHLSELEGGTATNATSHATLDAPAPAIANGTTGNSTLGPVVSVKGNITLAMAKTAEKLAAATDDENVSPPALTVDVCIHVLGIV